MTRDQQLHLIVQREVVERVRQRSFVIGLALTLVILALIVVLPSIFGGGGTKSYRIGVVKGLPAAYAHGLSGSSSGGVELKLTQYPDRAAADAAVAAGRVKLALLDPSTISVGTKRSATAEAIVQGLTVRVRSSLDLVRDGFTPAQVSSVLATPAAAIRAAPGVQDAKSHDERKTVAAITSFFLYFQLISLGFIVASGVVEEKASRVIEILLAAVRPRTLLAGKVIGIGIVGLLQITAQAIVGIALVAIFGGVDLSPAVIWIVAISIGFFLLGYAFYAMLFAGSASLVPRQEELQNVTTPLTLLLIGSYLLAFPTLDNPSSPILSVLSFVPPFSVLTMPIRLASGSAGPISGVASGLVLVAAILLITAPAARVYARSVLATGARVSLRQALFGTR